MGSFTEEGFISSGARSTCNLYRVLNLFCFTFLFSKLRRSLKLYFANSWNRKCTCWRNLPGLVSQFGSLQHQWCFFAHETFDNFFPACNNFLRSSGSGTVRGGSIFLISCVNPILFFVEGELDNILVMFSSKIFLCQHPETLCNPRDPGRWVVAAYTLSLAISQQFSPHQALLLHSNGKSKKDTACNNSLVMTGDGLVIGGGTVMTSSTNTIFHFSNGRFSF